MESSEQPVNDNAARNHLQHICEMSQCIVEATHFIAANDLHGLRESIAQQEVLTQSILFPDYRRNTTNPSALEREIASAMQQLYRANLQYSALLRHAGKTMNMLMTLNRSYRGDFHGRAEVVRKHQTWACEV